MTTEEFKQLLLETIFEGEKEIPTYELTEEDWKEIYKISEERYRNWDWNYGKSPKFNLQHSHRFPVGQVDVRLEVKKGTVTECKIYGDFFGALDVHDIEERLTGVQFDKEAFLCGVRRRRCKTLLWEYNERRFLSIVLLIVDCSPKLGEQFSCRYLSYRRYPVSNGRYILNCADIC